MLAQRGTRIIYFKSLNESFLVMGVDRQLFYLGVGICLPIAFSARLTPLMDGVAALLFFILYSFGMLITRADQQMLAIYRRHIRYRKYYDCHPGIAILAPPINPSVPYFQGRRSLV